MILNTVFSQEVNLFFQNKIKECFSTVKQVFFSYTKEGSLVDNQAY